MKKPVYILFIFLFLSNSIIAQDNSLYFDGNDDKVVVPAASALITGSPQISLSCWVFPENTFPSFPDYDGFCGFRNDIDADFYFVQFTPDTVEARFRNSNGQNFDIIDTSIQLFTWQHYVLTYDGSLLNLYRNGALKGSVAASGMIITPSEPLYIGDVLYNLNDFFLHGRIDEVSLWNKALTAAEVSCIYETSVNPTSTGLVLYYKFDQGVANSSNFAEDTLYAVTGILNAPLSNFSLTGLISNWSTGVENNTVNDSICDGQIYPFGSQNITSPGTYTELFVTTGGCDSIVRLVLSPTINLNVIQNGNTLNAVQQNATYQWIDCDLGNMPVANETNSSFTPADSGNYSVIISYNGCTDTSACNFIINAIEDDILYAGLTISPNPAPDFIRFSEEVYNSKIEIHDLTGRSVYSASANSFSAINISFLNKGIYIITLTGQTGKWRQSFIKQ